MFAATGVSVPAGTLLTAAVCAAAVVSVALVSGATSAGLRADRTPADGVARLTDDDRGAASFAVPALLPGRSSARCVAVTYHGAAAGIGEVRLFGRSSGALVDHLHLSVHHGQPGATCGRPGELTPVFDGPLGALGTDHASGAAGHRPVGSGTSVPYLFEVTLDADTPNRAQGAGAAVDFLWEVRPSAS